MQREEPPLEGAIGSHRVRQGTRSSDTCPFVNLSVLRCYYIMMNSGGSALSVSVEIPRLCCRWISAAHALEAIIVLMTINGLTAPFKINWTKNKLLFHPITITYSN